MFFSLDRKLKKSYSAINPEIGKIVFPKGEKEYIYVGTHLNALFRNADIFELIKIYASIYIYSTSAMGNIAKIYKYTKEKAKHILTDNATKDFVAFVLFNLTGTKTAYTDPVVAVRQYRGFVDSYINTVDQIEKYKAHFLPRTADAGTANSPLLVDGICGVRDYIKALNIPGVKNTTYEKTSTQYLTDELFGISYAIDEYTLRNAEDSSEIARIWFNIYGTENTDVLPACFSDKTPFSANAVADELVKAVVKESQAIAEIVQSVTTIYDPIKLVTASFAYLFVIWSFSFTGIKIYQAEEVEEEFVKRFYEYIQQTFDNAPYKAVLESEENLRAMLKRVDTHVRNSYHENNQKLFDDGLIDMFLHDCSCDADTIQKIQSLISKKLLEEWTSLSQDASEHYLF